MSTDMHDLLDCPYCGAEAISNPRQWGEHIYCGNCGYSREVLVTNLHECGSQDWIPAVETVENAKPYGAYYVVYKEGHADAGSLIDETSEEHLMSEIEKYRQDVVYAHIKEYINGEHKTRIIIDETKN